MIVDAALTFGVSYLVVAASPGPNFFVVSRAGLVGSRSASLRTAIGVVLGASVLTVLMVSCARWLSRNGRAITLMECIFAALLLHSSIQAFCRASTDAAEKMGDLGRDHRFLLQGFMTAASNPFTAAFLATAADRDLTPLDAVEIVFAVATLWFGSISFIFCRPSMRAIYDRRRREVEMIFGLAFFALFLRNFVSLVSHAR